jgi:hypothetical protein
MPALLFTDTSYYDSASLIHREAAKHNLLSNILQNKFPEKISMSIKSTVITDQILCIGSQAFDGFSIVIPDDEEFAGTYHFTEAYTIGSAHELIFNGDALTSEDNYTNC